jgi:hypothetical protein
MKNFFERAFVFVPIWVLGTYFGHHALELGSSWTMLYGFILGTACGLLADLAFPH